MVYVWYGHDKATHNSSQPIKTMPLDQAMIILKLKKTIDNDRDNRRKIQSEREKQQLKGCTTITGKKKLQNKWAENSTTKQRN